MFVAKSGGLVDIKKKKKNREINYIRVYAVHRKLHATSLDRVTQTSRLSAPRGYFSVRKQNNITVGTSWRRRIPHGLSSASCTALGDGAINQFCFFIFYLFHFFFFYTKNVSKRVTHARVYDNYYNRPTGCTADG